MGEDAAEEEAEEVACVAARAGFCVVGPPRPLTSVSNKVFVAETARGGIVVRLATRRREGVEHRAEVRHARQAWARGLAPEVLWCAPDTGELVTAFVDDRVPCAVDGVVAAVDPIAACLRALHSGPPFGARFDPLAVIDRLLDRAGRRDEIHLACRVLEDLAPVRSSLGVTARSAPCHNDPWPGNILLGDTAMLVDWEYSGQNDPAWDLADLSVEADLDPVAERRLLDAYTCGSPDEELTARVTMWKPFADVLWSAWSLVEEVEGNRADDFAAEARRRLDRAATLVAPARRAAAGSRGPRPFRSRAPG